MIRHALPPLLALAFLTTLLTACGYTIRGTSDHSPILENAGIHRIYVQPVVNNSYKAGIEITVYNALIKKLASRGEVQLVGSEADADAVLVSSVTTADYQPVSSTAGSNLEPTNLSLPFSTYAVVSIYNATLACKFSLESKVTKSFSPTPTKQKKWAATFNRNENFSANNTVGVTGTTSAIINDSQFDLALSDLADSMMVDVHEALISMF